LADKTLNPDEMIIAYKNLQYVLSLLYVNHHSAAYKAAQHIREVVIPDEIKYWELGVRKPKVKNDLVSYK
jgi:hypothetical protein